jgi:hypothetical protein
MLVEDKIAVILHHDDKTSILRCPVTIEKKRLTWIQSVRHNRPQSCRIGTGGRLSKAGREKGCITRQSAAAGIKLSQPAPSHRRLTLAHRKKAIVSPEHAGWRARRVVVPTDQTH